jgi:hypothetical protein
MGVWSMLSGGEKRCRMFNFFAANLAPAAPRQSRGSRSYFTEPKDVVAHPQLSRDEKLAILREWEQDALRLSTSESEGMGGGEESMLGRVEESIGVLERSPR